VRDLSVSAPPPKTDLSGTDIDKYRTQWSVLSAHLARGPVREKLHNEDECPKIYVRA
jgi:hypothetical protein